MKRKYSIAARADWNDDNGSMCCQPLTPTIYASSEEKAIAQAKKMLCHHHAGKKDLYINIFSVVDHGVVRGM